jgi:hypothetical protein
MVFAAPTSACRMEREAWTSPERKIPTLAINRLALPAAAISLAMQRSGRRPQPPESKRDTLLRLDQFRLDHAPSLFQGFHLSFRRVDNLLRERCNQPLKSVVSVDRKHPEP